MVCKQIILRIVEWYNELMMRWALYQFLLFTNLPQTEKTGFLPFFQIPRHDNWKCLEYLPLNHNALNLFHQSSFSSGQKKDSDEP